MLLVRKRRVHSWFLVHHLFANHPLPMLVYDVEALVVLDVNNAVMASYGHTREEVVGMHITRLLPPEDVPALLAIIHDTVRPGRAPYRPPMLWRHVYKNGHIRDVEIAAHDYDFDGRDAVLVSISDVTERLHAERERDALLAQLSHEVIQKAAIIEPSPDLAVFPPRCAHQSGLQCDRRLAARARHHGHAFIAGRRDDRAGPAAPPHRNHGDRRASHPGRRRRTDDHPDGRDDARSARPRSHACQLR